MQRRGDRDDMQAFPELGHRLADFVRPSRLQVAIQEQVGNSACLPPLGPRHRSRPAPGLKGWPHTRRFWRSYVFPPSLNHLRIFAISVLIMRPLYAGTAHKLDPRV